MRLLDQIFLCFVLVAYGTSALAHKNQSHNSPNTSEAKALISDDHRSSLVNAAYLATVKPIFRKSCFDCHGQASELPWYHELPIVRGVIDRDMNDAKEHLDMSNDFPFSGHGTPISDLEAIEEVLTRNSMPPLRYRVIHWSSYLTEVERQTVLKWAVDGRGILLQGQN